MPPKKRFPNSRFQPSRIKKIMQTDEEIGKVAKAVPVLISRAIELFMQKLLHDAETAVSQSKTYRTILPQHIKQAITNTQSLNFLSGLVENIPDLPPSDKSTPISRKRPHPKMSKQEPAASFIHPSVIVSPPIKRERSTDEEPTPEPAQVSPLPLSAATATTSYAFNDSNPQTTPDSLTKPTIPG
ncbi:Oidioi.mRNA.OKI2018_I69.PAR.g10807.t1.cds [Oikopleura dioica]|uniref:Oidioi.mRNA.OKI2018_I69.PAR.g10807.t1.cds n=1 Tax=Oikopleura dioica TaxID=34765 RepID=A0ABN7RVX6_OIKDI|nr:Oidioi.mRNA.OKI2018_I69.PAR.g10807.t1.cds [Oikopleura dioica]